jgi:hypothetical protein
VEQSVMEQRYHAVMEVAAVVPLTSTGGHYGVHGQAT